MQRRGMIAGARLRSPELPPRRHPAIWRSPFFCPGTPQRGAGGTTCVCPHVPRKQGTESSPPSLRLAQLHFPGAAHARIQPRSLLAGAKYRYSHTHDKCSLVSFLTHRRVWREKTSKHGHRLPWHSGRAILSSPHFPPLQTSCCNYHDACPPAGVLENWLPRQSLISPHYPAGMGSL